MANIERINTVVNMLTGEVVSQQKNVISIKPMAEEPAYIKMYIDDISRVLGLQHGHQEILLFIAASVDYEGIASLAIGRKARIAATVGCSIKSIDNAITEYIKQGILTRVARGEYELDPKLFAKGKWRDIRERRMSFKSTIIYSAKGEKTIETIAIPIS